MLTIGSRVLFCRTCSESCGDGHYFSVYQRVCPWPLYLASNNLFIPLSTPSFTTPSTIITRLYHRSAFGFFVFVFAIAATIIPLS